MNIIRKINIVLFTTLLIGTLAIVSYEHDYNSIGCIAVEWTVHIFAYALAWFLADKTLQDINK